MGYSEAQVRCETRHGPRQHVFFELFALRKLTFQLIKCFAIEVVCPLLLRHLLSLASQGAQSALILPLLASERAHLVILHFNKVACLSLLAVEVLVDFHAQLHRNVLSDLLTVLKQLIDDGISVGGKVSEVNSFAAVVSGRAVDCGDEVEELTRETFCVVLKAAIKALLDQLFDLDCLLRGHRTGLASPGQRTHNRVKSLLRHLVLLP